MLSQNFRKAAKALGMYIPERSELQIRKGGRIYRFFCEDGMIRFAPPGGPEVEILVAPDATVWELRRGIALYCDPH